MTEHMKRIMSTINNTWIINGYETHICLHCLIHGLRVVVQPTQPWILPCPPWICRAGCASHKSSSTLVDLRVGDLYRYDRVDLNKWKGQKGCLGQRHPFGGVDQACLPCRYPSCSRIDHPLLFYLIDLVFGEIKEPDRGNGTERVQLGMGTPCYEAWWPAIGVGSFVQSDERIKQACQCLGLILHPPNFPRVLARARTSNLGSSVRTLPA